ncbi:type II toxin-antitoxin system VapC family toxin [Nostoc sp. FACHB-973]|uniref:Type II toxin-antitoxin system VapC family toxin n=1 Tax=Desmonostoc muscorum LEGE 12446 TaxID=1828758 RepID=A0A8J7A0H7_DESMC|nr:type II toxin-antitoxin system VapC family toxin [Desmonostoc muscorum]MBD2514777.1 type II toxin-antitoxin system VapC family toxin [Nostoc sp. FACHB-973]MBX9253915.1 type II toxin-antitoxin system VapC family toxin [Desmonostoc muscorum CCALA 125]MCF2148292.1 type II toxin-antitoxin system VapC family toxin [Desmonostoc muscorum LEGE 12446]
MKLLLDTHVIIWSAGNPEKLSQRVRNSLIDTNNFWVVSMASVWELQIKSQLGKLNLSSSLPNFIETQQRVNNLEILPIELTHIYALEALPSHHRDPFDRILIAQAIVEKIPLLSVDAIFDVYPVQRIWE